LSVQGTLYSVGKVRFQPFPILDSIYLDQRATITGMGLRVHERRRQSKLRLRLPGSFVNIPRGSLSQWKARQRVHIQNRRGLERKRQVKHYQISKQRPQFPLTIRVGGSTTSYLLPYEVMDAEVTGLRTRVSSSELPRCCFTRRIFDREY
jgi:hypothetical protein